MNFHHNNFHANKEKWVEPEAQHPYLCPLPPKLTGQRALPSVGLSTSLARTGLAYRKKIPNRGFSLTLNL